MTNRDESGRFRPGHALGGPGRPRRSKEEKYLKALTDALTLKSWREIVHKAIADAITGDFRARQWLSDYAIGKPVQIIELTAPDQALLSDLLAMMDSHNISAGEMFSAMIQEFALQPVSEEDDDD